MYIIRAEGVDQLFDGKVYEKQEDANSKARFFMHAYKFNFYVCKIVDISFFKAPHPGKAEAPKEATNTKDGQNVV